MGNGILGTVGYGDVYPITVGGKAFAAIISLVGIGVVAIPTGIISASFVEEIIALNEEKNDSQKLLLPVFTYLCLMIKKIFILGSGFSSFLQQVIWQNGTPCRGI